MRPPRELEARFNTLTLEQRRLALDLLKNGAAVIKRCGSTPKVYRDAWEAVIAYAMSERLTRLPWTPARSCWMDRALDRLEGGDAR